MKIYYDMNVSYRHAPGEWCPYLAYDTYTLCCFQTPFLYECDGGILEGNAGDLLLTEPDRVIYHGPRPDAKEGTVNGYVRFGVGAVVFVVFHTVAVGVVEVGLRCFCAHVVVILRILLLLFLGSALCLVLLGADDETEANIESCGCELVGEDVVFVLGCAVMDWDVVAGGEDVEWAEVEVHSETQCVP